MLLNSLDEYMIVDVMNCMIIDNNDNIIAQDRLTSTEVNISVDMKEIRGGKGNGIISLIGGGKSLEIKTSCPTFNYDILALQLGSQDSIKTGTCFAYKSELLDVSDGTFSLADMPIRSTLKIASKNGIVTDYSISLKEVVLGDKTIEKVKVVYQYITPEKTNFIEINSNSFSRVNKLVLETLVINKEGNPVAYLYVDIPKAKADGNFVLNTTSSREAVASEITWKALNGANGHLGKFRLIPINGGVEEVPSEKEQYYGLKYKVQDEDLMYSGISYKILG